MSILTRMQSGILSRAAWYEEHGYDYTYLWRSLGMLEPGEDKGILWDVLGAGKKARAAGEMATNAAYDGAVPVAYIPGYVTGRIRYRYTIEATYVDAASGATRVVTFEAFDSRQLRVTDMSLLAEQHAPDTSGGSPTRGRSSPPTQLMSVQNVSVLSLERWD